MAPPDPTTTNNPNQISNVRVEIPTFAPENLVGWFRVVEAQFKNAGITSDKTKFYKTLAGLPSGPAAKISDVVISSESYDSLKKELESLYLESKNQMFEKLLRGVKNLPGKPSDRLRELIKIAEGAGIKDESLIRHQFLQSLNSNIQPVLMTRKEDSLISLASLADELVNIVQPAPIFGVSSNTSSHSHSSHSHSEIPINVRPFYNDQRPRICRSHIYYANRAHNCREWCQYPDKSNVRQVINTPHQSRSNSRSNSPTRSLNR